MFVHIFTHSFLFLSDCNKSPEFPLLPRLGSTLSHWVHAMCQQLSSALRIKNEALAFKELQGSGANRGINSVLFPP